MGKHALIFNGVVADVVGSPFEVASGMMWVDITALDPPPEPEWTYVDGAFAPPVRPVPPAPTADQIRQALTSAVQRHLDTTAQQRGYDGILSLASYAASQNPPFAAEGDAGLAWRDAVWLHCYQVLADVQAGTRPIPTAAELIAELPPMVWPT